MSFFSRVNEKPPAVNPMMPTTIRRIPTMVATFMQPPFHPSLSGCRTLRLRCRANTTPKILKDPCSVETNREPQIKNLDRLDANLDPFDVCRNSRFQD